MTQPLNFAIRAIEAFSAMPCTGAPATRAGMRYLADKLRQAQVFVLPDYGQLLDRSKPRPEVPNLLMRPPFPVVALEYTASADGLQQDEYTACRCSRRIALAWEWADDLPPALRQFAPPVLAPGVVIASIAYYDHARQWVSIPAAAHIAYDDPWQHHPVTPFAASAVAAGRLTTAQVQSKSPAGSFVGLAPEALAELGLRFGNAASLMDHLQADLVDEMGAYLDLCMALQCRNVTAERVPAAEALNRSRIRAGKLPLKDFHVLKLGDVAMPGTGGSGDRNGPRSHLRRGHIRRLAADRVTWVNSTIVKGRGFVDKVYAL